MHPLRRWYHDASGAVADLGVLLPITAALVIGNGLDPGTALVGVGALYMCAGWYFKVVVPVQPIKAAAAIAIARDISPTELATAGVILGAVLVLLGITGLSRRLARAFATPIVRGLQLGIGLILIETAVGYASPNGRLAPLLATAAVAGLLVAAARIERRYPVALAVVLVAVTHTLVTTGAGPDIAFAFWQPRLNASIFDPSVIWSALVLLVIPQVPLTLGNAVVAVVDLEHRYYPGAATKVDARSISLSSGLANLAAGAVTGMPMCHGSGGLTAHYRAGARTYRMNLVIGGALLALGLFFGPTVLALIALVPVVVLAGFLAFTGLFHGSLAASLRGWDLAIGLIMGALGLLTGNLAVALGVGLVLYWVPKIARPGSLEQPSPG